MSTPPEARPDAAAAPVPVDPESRPPANMADVAARAGVSIATVSRALRDLPGVGQATRDRVLAAADELAYVVSPEASRLARRDTGRVAVVVPRIDVWFYAAMLGGIERRLREAGLDVLVYQVDGEAQRSRFFQELPARRKVDAVVLVALPVLAHEEQRLGLLGVEVIVAGGRLRDWPHVLVDDRAAAVRACEHLLDLGHRRIGLVRTSDTDGTRWSSDVERSRGYRDALAAAGVAVREEYVVTEPFGVGAGADGVDRLLALPEPPTALFAYSDEIAVAACRRLQERGVAVPRQLSVVGIDGHPLAALFDLTTVDQGVPAQAARAADLVLQLLAGDPDVDRDVVLETRLVVRGSTARPAGGQ